MDAEPEPNELTISGATMAWEPDSRLFVARYAPFARPRGADASGMQRWMDERRGDGPFGLLVDLANTDKVAIAWRFQWMSWFLANRTRMRVALLHAEAVEPVIIKAFALSTRTAVRAFPTEAEAREWLAGEQGAALAPERI